MAKRKRLKKELAHVRHYPKLSECKYWIEVINVEVFNNALDPVQIEVRRLRGAWGQYNDKSNTITLTNWFPSKEIFLNVLAHELIHAYQNAYGEPLGHGPSFWQWKKRFKNNGLYLSEKYYGKPFIVG
jgi:hypothetical protein